MSQPRTIRVLIVNTDPDERLLIAELLAGAHRSRYELTMVDSHEAGLVAMRRGGIDINPCRVSDISLLPKPRT